MANLPLPPSLMLIGRFALAGVFNTAVGFTVILALDIGLGVSPALANLAGYAVGILVSWTLQRRMVFRTSESGWYTKAKYLAAVGLSLAINQGVLWCMLLVLGDEPLARTFSQLAAMTTYTVIQFALFRLWVFRGADAPRAAV